MCVPGRLPRFGERPAVSAPWRASWPAEPQCRTRRVSSHRAEAARFSERRARILHGCDIDLGRPRSCHQPGAASSSANNSCTRTDVARLRRRRDCGEVRRRTPKAAAPASTAGGKVHPSLFIVMISLPAPRPSHRTGWSYLASCRARIPLPSAIQAAHGAPNRARASCS